MRNFHVLAETISLIEGGKLRGGAILRTIEEAISAHTGDKAVRSLLDSILVACSVPFIHLLTGWLQRGFLSDPAQEFFIRKRSDADPILYGAEASSVTSVLNVSGIL